jgi:dolichol-phosphate mannosyltransferase
VLVAWLLGSPGSPGFTTVILLVTFLGGLNLMCLGIVGEYVGRIHEQVKERPLYLVKEWVGFPQESPAPQPVPQPSVRAHLPVAGSHAYRGTP